MDFAEYLERRPQFADELRELLPTLQLMADIGRAPEACSAAPSNEPVANESLGDFRIVREVGRGGMGVVYEAEQLSLRRKVALKILPLAPVLDHRQLRRFHHEAQAAALLHYPQIVRTELTTCATLLAPPGDIQTSNISKTLQHWQVDADLKGVRETAELAKLPSEEQSLFEQLWKDVATLQSRADSTAK